MCGQSVWFWQILGFILKQRAIELIVEGFAKEIFTNIKDENIQSRVNQKIGQWLESVSNHDKN